MKDIKVLFMGTPEFAVTILEMLNNYTTVVGVVTQPDKVVGRKHQLTYSPVKSWALANNLVVWQPLNMAKDYQEILNISCDIIITCAYGQILPEEVLNYPKYGCINVHASLLPKYRGGAPIHWAIINGDNKTGVTIMYMDKHMDSGDIIAQEKYLIKDDDTTEKLFTVLSKIGADLLKKVLPSIIEGNNNRIKQDELKVTYAYNITRQDEHIDFNRKGNKIINQIRGLNSFPLANFNLNNQEYKAVSGYFIPKDDVKIGWIVDIKKDAIGIGCQDGIVYLTKLKPFGKKIMDVKDYLNGINKESLYQAVID